MIPFASILLGLLFWLSSIGIMDGVTSITVACIGSCLISIGAFIGSLKIDKEFIVYKGMMFYFTYQPCAFLVCLLLYPDTFEQRFAYAGLFEDGPYRYFFSHSMVPLMGLVFSVILRVTRGVNNEKNLHYYVFRSQGRLNQILIMSAFLNASIWLAAFAHGIAYFIRIAHKSIYLIPLVAGMYIKQSKVVIKRDRVFGI